MVRRMSKVGHHLTRQMYADQARGVVVTLKRPRTVQRTCPECGFATALTTAAMADYALRRHSCEHYREVQARAQRRLDRLAASGTERPCQHDGRHPHGDRVRYVIDKCRCRPCRDAASEYQRDLTRRHLYGKTIYVPADTARAHVRELQAQGMGWKRVARAAGLSASIVWKLLYGDPSRNQAPSKRIRPATEANLLAVTLDLAPGQKVDPTGTGRRLQALVALGWSVGQISAHTGLERQCLDAAIHGQGIVAATREAVREAYDRLWDQAPPESNQRERIAASRARKRAAANGWVPPLAWDDESIDNPDAEPDLGESPIRRGPRQRFHIEDVEFLVDHGMTREQIAHRLQVLKSAIEHACARNDRRDLLERMTRNAIAQENVA